MASSWRESVTEGSTMALRFLVDVSPPMMNTEPAYTANDALALFSVKFGNEKIFKKTDFLRTEVCSFFGKLNQYHPIIFLKVVSIPRV